MSFENGTKAVNDSLEGRDGSDVQESYYHISLSYIIYHISYILIGQDPEPTYSGAM